MREHPKTGMLGTLHYINDRVPCPYNGSDLKETRVRTEKAAEFLREYLRRLQES